MNDVIGRSNEEQIALLAQRAQQDGDDWRLKIGRAESPNGRIESLATFDAVTVEMIANADTWIPSLLGGTGNAGIYYLYLMHSKDRAQGRTTAMMRLPALSGNPIPSNQIEWGRIDMAGWPGPKVLVYPDPRSLGAAPGAQVSASPKPFSGAGVPPPLSPPAVPGSADALLIQLQAEQAKLADARRAAELEALRREQHEAQRRSDANLGEMREIVKTLAATATQRPQVNIVETLTAITAAIGPLVSQVFNSKREEQARRDEEERRRLEREEMQRAEMQKRHDALLEKVANQGAEVSKIMASMSEATATVTRTMLQTMTSVIDMGLGNRPQEDEGWRGIAKAFFSAMGERMAMTMSTPALPPSTTPTPPVAPAPAAPQPGFAGTAGTPAGGNEVSLLESLVGRIAERDPDLNGLADSIITAIQTDSDTQEALAESDGNIVTMFQKILGNEWAMDPENGKYAQQLLAVLGPKAQASGLLAPAGAT